MIVLIANAHPIGGFGKPYLSAKADKGAKTTLLATEVEAPNGPYPCKNKDHSKNLVAFYNQVVSEFIDVFGSCLFDKRAGVRQAWIHKTSFSRLVR